MTLQAMKILVLVITSDNEPRYIELQKLWKSYMHYDPDHVESYFIRADPNLAVSCKIEEDDIWSRAKECHIPGIIEKTVHSLEYLLPRLKEFDFVIRTNLSSFYIFPRLLKFLETLPKKQCYAGPVAWENATLVSGCGIILSSDIAEFIANQRFRLFIQKNSDYDDVVLWRFLSMCRINRHSTTELYKVVAENLDFLKEEVPFHLFHLRLLGTPSEEFRAKLVELFYTQPT
jgi:hypothetical protein